MGPQLRFCRAHHRAGALGARSDALAKDEDLAGTGVRRHRPGIHLVDAVDPEDQAVILGLVPAYEPAQYLGHLAQDVADSATTRWSQVAMVLTSFFPFLSAQTGDAASVDDWQNNADDRNRDVQGLAH